MQYIKRTQKKKLRFCVDTASMIEALYGIIQNMRVTEPG